MVKYCARTCVWVVGGLVAAAALLTATPRAGAQTSLTVNITQAPRQQQILPGATTTVWSYSGTLVSGAPDSLVPVPNSYLGPTFHAWKGQQVTVNLTNQLSEDMVTHWHGLDVPADMDGHPSMPTPVGGTFTSSFPVLNRAGTYWYHPHPDMRTADQVQMGMAGFFIVHDPEEAALNLPSGEFDLPLCIQDRSFDANNQLVFEPNMMSGFFGTTMLVNGWPDYVHPTQSRVYRLRLLNGSSSRIYKLAFSDGTPMVVIGNDGGLLAAPQTKPYLMLSPGERAEVWADFRGKTVGTQITLRSLTFSGGGSGQGTARDVMRFSITQAVTESRSLPVTLSSITSYQLADAVNVNNPKTYAINFVVLPGDMPAFTINGGLFAMDEVAANEVAQCHSLEVIRITNTTGSVQIPHPFHFHGRQFQILDRTVTAAGLANWNTVKDGYNDSGWKDTFMIMPGETVRILLRHGGYPGLFLYHCHNLVHEDMGMMRNFRLDEPACPADIGVQGGSAGSDGLLDNNDFIVFINYFFNADGRADLGRQGGVAGPDSFFDNNDFIVYIDEFFTGC